MNPIVVAPVISGTVAIEPTVATTATVPRKPAIACNHAAGAHSRRASPSAKHAEMDAMNASASASPPETRWARDEIRAAPSASAVTRRRPRRASRCVRRRYAGSVGVIWRTVGIPQRAPCSGHGGHRTAGPWIPSPAHGGATPPTRSLLRV